MTRKHERQAAILELVASHVVSSQEELRQLLLARGMDVTQATLSRDLRDLHLARVSEAGARDTFCRSRWRPTTASRCYPISCLSYSRASTASAS